ncbi:hypothetical protein [Martelella soudanensis]|uniref:hypothetical protein n=1 Tax=unclassified Martelella TaxID=2629616 RepID=UPI0015DE42FF|nr:MULTISPECIES: hypothetical protein [unclassified Martelella]
MRRVKVADATRILGTIATPVLHPRMLTRDVFEFLSDDDPEPLSYPPSGEVPKRSGLPH